MGSDKLATLRERILILTFLLMKPDGTKEEVVFELNKEELDTFLKECGNINAVLQTIS